MLLQFEWIILVFFIYIFIDIKIYFLPLITPIAIMYFFFTDNIYFHHFIWTYVFHLIHSLTLMNWLTWHLLSSGCGRTSLLCALLVADCYWCPLVLRWFVPLAIVMLVSRIFCYKHFLRIRAKSHVYKYWHFLPALFTEASKVFLACF